MVPFRAVQGCEPKKVWNYLLCNNGYTSWESNSNTIEGTRNYINWECVLIYTFVTWKSFFSYFDHKAEDSPISCDITTGYILKGVLYFIGLECYEPDGPDGGTKQCNEFGGSKFCTVTCNSGSQLYLETASYWQCNKGVWTPSDVIPDCVGKTNPDKPHHSAFYW